MKILYIEDDTEFAYPVINTLLDAGHSVEHRVSAGPALTEFRTHPIGRYDVILCDHDLNDIDGWEVVKEVRKVDGTFVSLWHNESLSEMPPWEGWSGVYEEMVKMASGE